MPVTKEQLAQYVGELGLPTEQTASLIETLLTNQTAAAQFVGQRLRHDDYTKKTQDVATHKQQLEQQANTQITGYATKLAEANNKIGNIMKELEEKDLTAAQANARLRTVKEKFGLSDDDIPALQVNNPAGTGDKPTRRDPAIDIDKKLEDFSANLLKTIRADLLSMPKVTAAQTDIQFQHQELTGKRLTRSDMNELLESAQKGSTTLESAWEQKYGIRDLRVNQIVEQKVKERMDAEDAKRKSANSEAALAGVRNVDPTRDQLASPVLRKRFATEENSGPGAAAGQSQQHQQPQQQAAPGPKLSGAERAAAKFLERRNNGMPLGAPNQA